jgi:hypothetical protein
MQEPVTVITAGLTIADPATVLRTHADDIRALGKRTIANTIEIGHLLTEAKEIVGHGNFGPWLDREFGWSERTARNFMGVYELARTSTLGKPEKFADLGIPVSDLYLLAAPSTPEEVRDEMLARAEAGEPPTRNEIKGAIAENRQPVQSKPTGSASTESGEPEPSEKKPQPAKRGRARRTAAGKTRSSKKTAAGKTRSSKKSAAGKRRRNPKPTPELERKVVQAISAVKGVLKPFSPGDRTTICDRAIADLKTAPRARG